MIEKTLGRLTCNHPICDRVGVHLVRVADLADAALQVNARPLLDDVSRLMGRGVEIRRAGERYGVSHGVGLRPELIAGDCRGTSDVGFNPAHVVSPEGLLDSIEMRERLGAALNPASRHFVHLSRILPG